MLDNKYLWSIVETLRNELKDRKEENYTLQLSLLECVNDYEELLKENDSMKMEIESLNNGSKLTFNKLELVT